MTRRFSGAAALVLLAANAYAQDAPTPSGEEVFGKWCAICHGEGVYMGGTLALEAKYRGALPALLTERTDMTQEFVRLFVRTGVGSMAPFRKTEISDAELDALAHFLATSE